jgi:hypothetical protein
MLQILRPPAARKLVALVLGSLFVAGSGFAQTRGVLPAGSPATALGVSAGVSKSGQTTVTYKQKTNYDFDDDQVEGTLVQPDTDLITGRLRSSHESLVRLRTTFQPEMLKSVESL